MLLMSIKRKIVLSALGILLIGGTFWFGAFVGYSAGRAQCPVCAPEALDFSLFWEAYNKLQDNFVNGKNIDKQKIIYGAISGMVKALDDPYTVFFPPKEAKVFEEDVRGVFEGVGMEIGIRKGQLQVIAPLEGTPAKRAGLRPGDKILKVDDTSTVDMTLDEAVRLIRGPKGTKVVLTIFRDTWDKSREIEIERTVIEIPSLSLEIRQDKIAYLKLFHFSEKAATDFRKAAIEILNSDAQKIVLDLRNNPGGLLEVAQNIGGWFLQRGEIVAIEDFGNGKKTEFNSQGPSRLANYPIVVLINEGSASAAEILAGALRDNRGVLLVGTKSFGKGSVQTLEKLRDGSSLKITVARWLTPKGATLSGNGLEPDIKVEMTDEDFNQGKDPQLEKALEVIKNL